MSVAKEKMTEIIQTQPDDSSYEEILRELFFVQMIERGLMDVKKGNVISNEEMREFLQVVENSVAVS
jgi:hypothetical protein